MQLFYWFNFIIFGTSLYTCNAINPLILNVNVFSLILKQKTPETSSKTSHAWQTAKNIAAFLNLDLPNQQKFMLFFEHMAKILCLKNDLLLQKTFKQLLFLETPNNTLHCQGLSCKNCNQAAGQILSNLKKIKQLIKLLRGQQKSRIKKYFISLLIASCGSACVVKFTFFWPILFSMLKYGSLKLITFGALLLALLKIKPGKNPKDNNCSECDKPESPAMRTHLTEKLATLEAELKTIEPINLTTEQFKRQALRTEVTALIRQQSHLHGEIAILNLNISTLPQPQTAPLTPTPTPTQIAQQPEMQQAAALQASQQTIHQPQAQADLTAALPLAALAAGMAFHPVTLLAI